VVTGEASFHAPYDYCTVKYLGQAGVDVEYADLSHDGLVVVGVDCWLDGCLNIFGILACRRFVSDCKASTMTR
jgi:hypothetical protein